jgi:hypothetical protein
MILKESVREKIWDKLENVIISVQNLKGIVQNEMDLSQKDYWYFFDEWKESKISILKKLDQCQNELLIEIGSNEE